ncbi:MAG TPA: hypothetical protein VK694_03470 [Verrucomicrobiae bacterium]|nr:hypothetical protein [Verrucomicrobiae bacterium]
MRFPFLLCFKFLYGVRLKKTSIRLARLLERFCSTPLEDSKLYDDIWEFVAYHQKDFTSFCQDGGGCSFPILSDTDRFHRLCRASQAAEDALDAEMDQAEMELLCHSCWDKPAVKDRLCQICWDNQYLCRAGCGKPESECDGNCHTATLCKSLHCSRYAAEDGYCMPCWEDSILCSDCRRELEVCTCDIEDNYPDGYDTRDEYVDSHDETDSWTEARCGGDRPGLMVDDEYDDGYYDPDEDICPGICGQPAYACTCAETASLREHNANPNTRGSTWVA